MAIQTLKIVNLSDVPFHAFVQSQIEKGLDTLVQSSHLKIDFTGKKRGNYTLEFDKSYSWSKFERIRCWYKPSILGMTGGVFIKALEKRNYCEDVTKCRTCEPVFRRSRDELGKAISNTALHEIGHLFGLMDKSSYTGANSAGHTGDSSNFMFTDILHKDYKRIRDDWERTKKHTIAKGETLLKIAQRIGFRSPLATWKTLYNFKGRDGKQNKDILRSKDPDLIFPGEEIWIPDYQAKRLFLRKVEVQDKKFIKSQFDTMRNWLKAGRTIYKSP